jgi:hypothetical protein
MKAPAFFVLKGTSDRSDEIAPGSLVRGRPYQVMARFVEGLKL